MTETMTPDVVSEQIRVSEPKTFAASFTGTGSEYFRIWIVNVALTIVTFGIYSAWAKVRTKKYFYNHTVLDGSNFDYHADPIKILKGRILIAIFFGGYTLGGKISPVIGMTFGLVIMALVPWILVRSMRFNLANSSFRGVRFGFDGTTSESYGTYMKALAITIFTIYLGYPEAQVSIKRFQVDNSRYGKSKFNLAPETSFYSVYGRAVLIMILAIISVFAIVKLGVFNGDDGAVNKKILVPVLLMGFYGVLIFIGMYTSAGVYNLQMNGTKLESLRFKSTISNSKLMFVYGTNVLACLFTLGLLYPWAKVRVARSKLSNLALTGEASALEKFQAGALTGDGAVADAASDFMEVDLGF